MNVPGHAERHHHPGPHLCSSEKQLLPPNCRECFCASPAGLAASEWNPPSRHNPLRLPIVAFHFFAFSHSHVLINLYIMSKCVSPSLSNSGGRNKKKSIKVSWASANIPSSGGTNLRSAGEKNPFLNFCSSFRCAHACCKKWYRKSGLHRSLLLVSFSVTDNSPLWCQR